MPPHTVEPQTQEPGSSAAKADLLDFLLVLAFLSGPFLAFTSVNGAWLPLTLILIKLYCLSILTCVTMILILYLRRDLGQTRDNGVSAKEDPGRGKVGLTTLGSWRKLSYLWMAVAVWCLAVVAASTKFGASFDGLQPSEAQARAIGMVAVGCSLVCIAGTLWGVWRTGINGNWRKPDSGKIPGSEPPIKRG